MNAISQGYGAEKLTLEALRSAPIPDFIPRDPFQLKAWYVAKFEETTDRTLYPGQPEMYVIEIMAYAHATFGEAAQLAFLQNRAIWAEGRHLEEVGANVSTFRLGEQTAGCDVRFTLSAIQPHPVLIAAGKRVAAGELVFETQADLYIPAGQLTGDVAVLAGLPGASFNGFMPGQINSILDPQAYVSTVENIDVSGGGSDIEDQERYRLRVVNALERVSKAGPRQAYIEQVKAVNPAIVDVEVIKPEPGFIEITPLMLVDGKGAVSNDTVDAAILAHLDPETLVPMGDYISIRKASKVVFDVSLNVRVDNLHQSSVLEGQIAQAVENAFKPWGQVLGARIAPSAVQAAVKAVSRVVDVSEPGFDYTDLTSVQFAELGTLSINLIDSPNV